MKQIHKGGNPMRNLGLILLLLHMTFFYISAGVYMSQNNPEWFPRAAIGSILLGLYLIADKEETKIN